MPEPVLRLLHVENDENDRFFLQRAIQSSMPAIRLTSAADGEQALAMLKGRGAEQPDLVLLDIRMPLMDGFEFLQRFMALEDIKQIPVMMFSTSGQAQDVKRARELGATAYVIKPHTVSELRQFVQRLYAKWQSNELSTEWPDAPEPGHPI